MFTFIAFVLKLLFAAVLGGVLPYESEKANGDVNIQYSSMFSVLAAALLGLGKQLTPDNFYLFAGFAVVSLFISVVYLTKSMEMKSRLIFLLSLMIGIIIGAGYILRAIVFTAVVYFILRQGDSLLSHLNPEIDDDSYEEIED
jgi:uncharacterized membrane protein YhiD involved in acid resistance